MIARDAGATSPWPKLHGMTTLLAFDTATERMSIALSARGAVHAHEAVGGAQASASLIPAILSLLRQAGVGLAELDAIAFGRGPGAFTGLRTACSVAQGLALGAGKPVLPVDTLLVVAESAREGTHPQRIWVATDARMDEVYAAAYRHDGRTWQVPHAPALYDLAALAAQARRNSALARSAQRGQRLACAAWVAGRGVPAERALPVYLRDKVALTTAERAAARAASGSGSAA